MASTARPTLDRSRSRPDAKAMGAFYTDAGVADFLARWAIRAPHDTVLDPSFGDGVFLRAACERLRQLGGQPAVQVFGAEISPEVHAQVVAALSVEWGIRRENLLLSDFFALDDLRGQQVDAVIGNPPFIRYQQFAGEMRERALARAAVQGVRLTQLTSSWAPFLVHSIALLKPGGRLAMVVPMELAHAGYALPVLGYLSRSFRRVTFLTFQSKLFPDLSEDTLLLLAEDKEAPLSLPKEPALSLPKGQRGAAFSWRDLAHAGLLAELPGRETLDRASLPDLQPLDGERLVQGSERLIAYLLPRRVRELYRELQDLPTTKRLGDLADVGIGYVTGANDFFHLHPAEARFWDIPEALLRPAVRRGRALSGLRFTTADWRDGLAAKETGCLLFIEGRDELAALPDGVRRYLEHGEKQGVSKAYKCRTRSPWFRVPHVHRPDAFLTYMSGQAPRLVANDAAAVASNTLHVLRLQPRVGLTGAALAALWQTSLTSLSVELEGHALGGGMLKLEPTEAENVLVPCPATDGRLAELAEELDVLLRRGDRPTARERADRVILHEGLGLSQSDCQLLRSAADLLRDRRHRRDTRTGQDTADSLG